MTDRDATATGECCLSGCFCHEAQQSTFDRKWQQAPQSMKRTTEYETATYWCEIGRQLERGGLVELINSEGAAMSTPAKEETLGEVAERIAGEFAASSPLRGMLTFAILTALRNEREACAQIADEHLHDGICERVGCKVSIGMAIRGRTE